MFFSPLFYGIEGILVGQFIFENPLTELSQAIEFFFPLQAFFVFVAFMGTGSGVPLGLSAFLNM